MNDQPLSDRDLQAAFAARASGAPSPDLAARISAQTARTRQSRSWFVLPAFVAGPAPQLAWAAVVALLTVAIIGALVMGVGRNDAPAVVAPIVSPSPTVEPSVALSPSADPSVVPSPSADPSAEPTVAASGDAFVPAGLGPDRVGHVVATDGLRVRTLPTVGGSSKPLEPMLDRNVPFYVVAGPVFADGYAWYQIDPYGGDPSLPFGWVAAGSREGQAWIELFLDGCDTVYPSIEMLGTHAAQELLYCYGVTMPDDYELTGTLFCDLGDVEGLQSGPEWVEFDRFCELRDGDTSFRVWGKPATSLLESGIPVDGRYTVVGHFDDPGSSSCTAAGQGGDAPDPAEAVLFCRMQFVVTEVAPAP